MTPRTTRNSRAARTAIIAGSVALVAALAGAAGTSIAAAPTPPDQHARCDVSVPYSGGTDGYAAFRIPAIVTAADGDLLAFAEGRFAGLADAGNIDLVLKRSSDGGCTWGPLQVIHDSGNNTSGNPTPVVTATGRVVLVSTYNTGTSTEALIMQGKVPADQSRRVFVQYSDDNGATWSAQREITAQTKLEDWRWYATGPGHAIRLASGPHRNRLVIPANHSVAPPTGSADLGTEAKYYGGHLLYSDDNGETWHIGSVDDNANGYLNVNESTVAELPDGRVYVNSRDQNGTSPGNRSDAYSLDGGQTLQKPQHPQATLIVPAVEGSVLQLSGKNAPLVFSGPNDPTNRVALNLRTSTDNGQTWRPAFALSGLPAAYSDLVQLDKATIGVLYETGDFGANETITFRRVSVGDLRP